ncbi:MAG TPA: hypothetical protein VNF68_14220 [Candidatus Baltobacteraceae bacterium]|nr:hypothetical protein [Candidatus Baltobacteraceae bacterium]
MRVITAVAIAVLGFLTVGAAPPSRVVATARRFCGGINAKVAECTLAAHHIVEGDACDLDLQVDTVVERTGELANVF